MSTRTTSPGNPMTRVARHLGRQRWFSDIGKRIVPLDLALQRRTGGRLSLLKLAGMPSMLLITTGRRTGRTRETPLLYVPHGREYVVIGSNWGGPRHPAWSANLLAQPEAVVRIGTREVPVRARLVEGAEREQLWREVITPAWPAYDDYAARAGQRRLRVFVLSPR